MKKIVAIFFFILLLFGIMGAIISNVINWNEYRPQIAKMMGDKIGQDVQILGDIKLEFLPVPHISMQDIHVFERIEEKEVVNLPRLNIYFAPKSLLGGVLKISDIQIDSPTFYVEGGTKMLLDLEKKLNRNIKKDNKQSGFIQFNKLRVKNGTMRAKENKIDKPLAENIELYLNFETIKGPFELSGAFKYGSKDLKIDLITGQFSSNLAPIELNIITDMGDIKLNGTIGLDNGFYMKGKVSSSGLFLANIDKEKTSFSSMIMLTKNNLRLDNLKLNNNNISKLTGFIEVKNYKSEGNEKVIIDVKADKINLDDLKILSEKNLNTHIKLKVKNFIYKKSHFNNVELDMRQSDGNWQVTQFVSNINKTTKIEAVGRVGVSNKTYDMELNIYAASIEDLYNSGLKSQFDKNILEFLKIQKKYFKDTRFIGNIKNIKNGYELSGFYLSFGSKGKEKHIKGDIKYTKIKEKKAYDISTSIRSLKFNTKDLKAWKDSIYKNSANLSKKKKVSFDIEISGIDLGKSQNFKDISLKGTLENKVVSLEQGYLKNANDNSELWADGHFELSQPISDVDFQLRLKNGKVASLFQFLDVGYPSYIETWKNDESSIVIQGSGKNWTVSTDIKTDTTSLQLSGDIKGYDTNVESYKANMRLQQKDVSNIWSFFDIPKYKNLNLKGDLDFYAEISKNEKGFEFKNIQSLINKKPMTGDVILNLIESADKENKYAVKADLKIDHLNINDLMERNLIDKALEKSDLSSFISLPMMASLDLGLKTDIFTYKLMNIKNTDIQLTYSPSEIIIKKITGQSHGKPIAISGYLKRSKNKWDAKAEVKTSKLDAGMVSNLFNLADIKLSDVIDFDMSVTGNGKNTTEIISNLSGYSKIQSDEGFVNHLDIASVPLLLSALNGVTNDLDNKLLAKLNTHKMNYKQAVLNFNLKDGLAVLKDSYFIVSGQKIKVNGSINIAHELYDLVFNVIYKMSNDSLYGNFPSFNLSRSLKKGQKKYVNNIESENIRSYLSRKFSIYMENKLAEEPEEEKQAKPIEEISEPIIERKDYGDDIEVESLKDRTEETKFIKSHKRKGGVVKGHRRESGYVESYKRKGGDVKAHNRKIKIKTEQQDLEDSMQSIKDEILKETVE